MIGEAGGLTSRANEKNVKIIRGEQNNLQVTQIDLSDIKSISDPRSILQSGDIIYIAENKHAVYTDKNQNFVTTIQPGLLILSTAILIFTLIRR
jgi:polysaccharide export outer membrane protein